MTHDRERKQRHGDRPIAYFVKRIFGVLAFGTAMTVMTAPTAAAAPNIIVMVADDLGWADVGYHGSDIATPSIDRLADEGMRLERFYSNPICTPTRAALLTGRDALRLGVGYFPILAWSNKAISPTEHFMPETFKAAGFQTGMVGKWHLGHTLETQTPNARGFDDFFGHLHTQVFYYAHTTSGGHDLQHNGSSVRREGRYLTDVHGEEAVRFIKDRDPSKPFFLYVPFLAPHSPMEAPVELIKKYADRPVIELPATNPLRGTIPTEQLRQVQQVYAAMVDSMDQAIDKILTTLDEEGIAGDTIVLFFSDNGGFNAFGSSNVPLRGEKMTVFEGGIRVPAVIRWPGKIASGTESHQLISVVDVFPTLASAAGVAMKNRKPLDGASAWPLTPTREFAARSGDIFFVAEQPTATPYFYSVIRDRWKLIQVIHEDLYTKRVQNLLYDIANDPNETNDLANEMPELVATLATSIATWAASHPVGGQHVEIAPNPGWLPPRDWADVVIPASKVLPGSISGFSKGTAERLDKAYEGRGRVIYD
jgi:arylsulfatase A-like enzyme